MYMYITYFTDIGILNFIFKKGTLRGFKNVTLLVKHKYNFTHKAPCWLIFVLKKPLLIFIREKPTWF